MGIRDRISTHYWHFSEKFQKLQKQTVVQWGDIISRQLSVQDFVRFIGRVFLMKLSLIEVSFSWLNENLFLLKLRNKSRTINVFHGTIRPSNPAQFQFFPHPVRILGYYFSDGFHLELRSNVSFGVDNLKKQNVNIFIAGFVVLTKGTKLFKWQDLSWLPYIHDHHEIIYIFTQYSCWLWYQPKK